ncbi:hypothetical protein [Mesorhizobium sp.]|uniref:hypothetical protein n=1 Tax=Mesorhizobium sp. TaxID=1871066 RepID=UPI0003F50451|nr:hypothetical protein [Mesorhizobium sp.]RWN52770.1 MAG: hypothetical protein EOR98_21255 [Mesorhizobium sp.]RWN78485.1 MAG: hypothetical protein EOS01_16870 [Mesorhizobium sp.]RWO71735.1 MAG: hypothetical protein EOS16_06555 [Mesorhizobium sp.]
MTRTENRRCSILPKLPLARPMQKLDQMAGCVNSKGVTNVRAVAPMPTLAPKRAKTPALTNPAGLISFAYE